MRPFPAKRNGLSAQAEGGTAIPRSRFCSPLGSFCCDAARGRRGPGLYQRSASRPRRIRFAVDVPREAPSAQRHVKYLANRQAHQHSTPAQHDQHSTP
ncbi:hypothetical protein BV898_18984 [Hypsibius exemplaris]|uniref:Uncharacterized protein n=1 Tax=Hypsibius exemplaris TaxID=2072580 RepID=A0A9X6NJU9_HYPEX|nr:hypothetical protein BV898_18984 [Hypsibius exemplaris]